MSQGNSKRVSSLREDLWIDCRTWIREVVKARIAGGGRPGQPEDLHQENGFSG